MHHRRRVAALAVLLLTAALARAQELEVAAPGALGLSAERLERIDSVFSRYVADEQLPGAVVLIARRGGIAYLEAFGHRDRESGSEQRTDDIFRIASQTKAIVSTAIMMLQERGDLLIGHPVGRYLPEYAATTVAVAADDGAYEVVPANRPITIRDLLTHTAGIGYFGGPAYDRWEAAGILGWYFADRDEPIRETVRRMAPLPFSAQPGEAYVYGYATDILGAVVEVASGQPLDEFLGEHILSPLGMVDTHFYLPPDKRDRLATVYSLGEDGEMTRAPDAGGMISQGDYVEGPRRSFSGGAGLLSTARDYARFLQMMLDGGELDGVRILAPSSVELMTANHVGALLGAGSGSGFGLGYQVTLDLGARGLPGSVGEYGWGGAYHSTYWVDPAQELVVVYFTQLIPANGVDDHARLRALVYQAIVED